MQKGVSQCEHARVSEREKEQEREGALVMVGAYWLRGSEEGVWKADVRCKETIMAKRDTKRLE